jgi:formylglycine-generating enzyme required for sulfatase activity
MISKQRVGVQEWEVVKMWGAAQGYEIVGGKTDAVDGPLTHVNWYNALKWCNARSEKEGLLPVYRVLGGIYRKGEFGRDGSEAITWERKARGYRLPLECEWEWAARGGLLHYEVDHTAQIEDESNVNKIGLCDMSGDVFDWCWDLDDSGPFRRTRGGNWRHECEVLSFGYRASVPPDSFSGVIGLRMAMDIEGELVEYKKPVASPR